MGWGRDWGWVAFEGQSAFLHAAHVDLEQAVACGVVVEFVPTMTAPGLMATKCRVLHGVDPPPVGPRVTARVVQVVPEKGYVVVVADGDRRALAMFRDFRDELHIEPLADGDLVEGEIVLAGTAGSGRWRLMAVRIVKYYANRRS
jgi:hypothetical protein